MAKSRGDDENPEITQYLKSIRKYKMLSPQEEAEIGRLIEKGDKGAVNRLVNANLRYVVREAKRYRSSGVPFADLIAEGNLGMLRAAQKFDWRRGVKFITYAVWYIRQSIIDLIRAYGGGAEISECSIHDDIASFEQILTVNDTEAEDMETAFIDAKSRGETVARLTKCLKHKELSVLQKYFGLNGEKSKTLQEIGDEFGISKERIRQIKDKAMLKLRCNALVSDEFETIRGLC